MSVQIFDAGSNTFTRNIDAAIAKGTYRRGQLFAGAITGGVAAGESVLDYGCGPGRIAAMLAKAGYQVEGCDPSPLMLEEARLMPGAASNLHFTLADDNGSSLPDAAYGGIVCSSVIEFVPEPAGLLRNLHRTCKPGAVLALSFSNKRSLWRAWSKWRYSRNLPHFSVQYNSWTFAQAVKMLADNGFEVTSGPVYFEGGPFETRPMLKFMCSWALVGTLGFLTARRV